MIRNVENPRKPHMTTFYDPPQQLWLVIKTDDCFFFWMQIYAGYIVYIIHTDDSDPEYNSEDETHRLMSSAV